MVSISVSHLKKYFRIYKRQAGFLSSIYSFFSRPGETVKAVDDISFTIQQGELVGFIGPNGAGKTTTLKCLSGLLYPTSGCVSVLGFTPFERKNEFLKQISLVMGQKHQLWWDLPAIDTFELNKEIYDIPKISFKKVLDELSALLEVSHLLTTPVKQLSLGQRMKMELIACLLHQPAILFLDEPTIGLDVVMQKKIRDFIATYNQRFGATVILTSHYMADVKYLCQRVIIIDSGKIIYDGDLKSLIKKYADFKIVSVIFGSTSFETEKLERLGKIRSVDSRHVVFEAKKQSVKLLALRLLKEFPVEDLNIEEPGLEDVIRIVFEKGR